MTSRLALLFVPMLVACGARTPLESAQASAAADDGGVGLDSSSPHPEGSAGASGCSSWMASHAPVRISAPNGMVQLLTALPTSSGVLVGYANVEVPSPDPTWRVRRISYDAAELAPSSIVFQRDTSQLGWARISLVDGFGHSAAVAWDEADGMLFVPIDANGVPTSLPVRTPGAPARELRATQSGYTVLRTPYSGLKAPISLETLDLNGHVTAERQLVPENDAIRTVSRVSFDDGSFALMWTADGSCAGCRTMFVQHVGEGGEILAPNAALHEFGAQSQIGYALAASSQGLVAAWFEAQGTHLYITTAPLDRDGASAGASSHLVEVPGPNVGVLALGAAIGGDVVAAWTQQDGDSYKTQLLVQALTSAGAAHGPPVVLAQSVSAQSQDVIVVVWAQGAMVLYEDDLPGGTQVFAIPLTCSL